MNNDVVEMLLNQTDKTEIVKILRTMLVSGRVEFSPDEVYLVAEMSSKELREAHALSKAIETANSWMKEAGMGY